MNSEFEYWQTPHWTSRDDYPVSGDALPDWRWRWEFLRRDEGYQRAWQAGTPIEDSGNRMAHPRDLYRVNYLYELGNLFNPCFDPSGYRNIFSRSTGLIFRWSPPYQFLDVVEKLKPTDLLEFFRHYFRDQQDISERTKDGSLATAIFDLNKPLPPQLKQIEHLLKEQQKHQSGKLIQFRKRQKLWPRYLRILDAQAQGNPGAMKIYKHLLHEAEQHDVDLYDEMNVDNPPTLVSDWQTAANEVRNKAIRYL